MVGQTVSHYTILEKLGSGGMGVVYRAEDTRLKRIVALKFLPPDLTSDTDSKKRFIREARAASALDHPNICTIHDIGETPEGQLFICMALYEGETLKNIIDRNQISVEQVLDIGIKIARGLAKAHGQQIVHRDIKPANIIVTNDGEVKVLDFGLAKLTGTTRVTKTGSSLGTVAYMSPEQTRGEPLDARTDIFSLGVVLYELLAGRHPFASDNDAAMVYSILNKDPEPLAHYRGDAPEGLQQVIDGALNKSIEGRYQSMNALLDDLERISAGVALELPKRSAHAAIRGLFVPVAIAAAAMLMLFAVPQSRRAIMGTIHGRSVEKQIVVLPFENVGGDAANLAFCDGLMETLTSQLTQLEKFQGSFWVVPASEVRTRGVTSPSEAHKVFGVNLVVSGGVQRFADRFRVTLNVIDVSDPDSPRQLKSSVIDDSRANAAALQDEIIVRMAAMFGVELVPENRSMLAAGNTENSQAYEFYLEGRGYLQRYEREENIDSAISLFERTIKIDSLYALAYAGLGEAYVRKYRKTMDTQWIAPAVRNGKRAVELDDRLAPARVTLGMIYRETGEYERAIVELKNVLAVDPTNAAACQEMATTYADAGMVADAESIYRKAIQLRPDYWGCYYSLGVLFWRNDRPDEAVEQFQRVIELTPDNMWGYNSLGAAYYNLDRLDEAHEMFGRSIAAQPNYRAYANLATLDYVAGRYAEAANMYEKALEKNSSSYVTWGSFANACYWLPDRREEAYEHYRRAAVMAEEQRAVNARDPRLLSRLAGYCAMLGEAERADVFTRESLALAPDNLRIIYTAGCTYEQLGRRMEAVEYIARALTNGYSSAEFEADPWMQDLRADERFQTSLNEMRNGKEEKPQSH